MLFSGFVFVGWSFLFLGFYFISVFSEIVSPSRIFSGDLAVKVTRVSR